MPASASVWVCDGVKYVQSNYVQQSINQQQVKMDKRFIVIMADLLILSRRRIPSLSTPIDYINHNDCSHLAAANESPSSRDNSASAVDSVVINGSAISAEKNSARGWALEKSRLALALAHSATILQITHFVAAALAVATLATWSCIVHLPLCCHFADKVHH